MANKNLTEVSRIVNVGTIGHVDSRQNDSYSSDFACIIQATRSGVAYPRV
jgi:translation elongation factor EF-Tu-like GTPase